MNAADSSQNASSIDFSFLVKQSEDPDKLHQHICGFQGSWGLPHTMLGCSVQYSKRIPGSSDFSGWNCSVLHDGERLTDISVNALQKAVEAEVGKFFEVVEGEDSGSEGERLTTTGSEVEIQTDSPSSLTRKLKIVCDFDPIHARKPLLRGGHKVAFLLDAQEIHDPPEESGSVLV